MARIEGTQSIPSTWKEAYDGTVTPLMPSAAIRKRYPWKKPNKQAGGLDVTQAETDQRSRWLAVRNKFKDLDSATRARWYDARPVWNSLLWYYNYFMMSGLDGNAVIGNKGAGVIKDIHHYTFQLPIGTAPVATVSIDTCDPYKSVPFFFGAGVVLAWADLPVVVYPYLKTLASSYMVIGASMGLDFSANLSVTLIEYI